MKLPLFIHYECKTKNVEWIKRLGQVMDVSAIEVKYYYIIIIKVKYEGKISWLALKLCTFLSSIVVT